MRRRLQEAKSDDRALFNGEWRLHCPRTRRLLEAKASGLRGQGQGQTLSRPRPRFLVLDVTRPRGPHPCKIVVPRVLGSPTSESP